MKFFCVNEKYFDFAVLQDFVDAGICSLIEISMPAMGAPSSIRGESTAGRNMPASCGVKSQRSIAAVAQEHVDRNYRDYGCTLSSIAKSMYISPGYLSSVFKKIVGVTFNNYLTQLRVEKAQQLLTETELMIYEVSQLVGYENSHYFSTIFKKFTGFSPTDYRNQDDRFAV
mgnify:FL=1